MRNKSIMIINNKLDESYVTLNSIERAYDEGTLSDLIQDYLAFGGDIQDIYNEIVNSKFITVAYLDEIVSQLDMSNGNDNCDNCHDDENYYGEENDNYDDFSTLVLANTNMTEDIDDGRDIDIDYQTVADLLSGAMDNMSSEQIDTEISLFKKIAKTLGVEDYDDTLVVFDDGENNPDYILSDGVDIKFYDNDRKLKYYESANMVSEMFNGNFFFYFSDLESAKKYFKLADKFLNSDELSKDVFAYDNNHAKEWSERHPNGYYNDEGDYSVEEEYKPETIEEALNLLDKRTGNQYNLLNAYLEENLSDTQRNKVIDLINENADVKTISKYLTEAGGRYTDEEKESKEFIMNQVRSGYNGEFSIKFMDPFAQQKIEKWLRLNKFDFESLGNELTILLSNNKSTNDLKIDEAKKIRENLKECIKVLDDFISGKLVNDTDFELLYHHLSDATYDCRDYLLRG